ncbi:serine O-acetyltransferase [Caulobacter flavus]|uniref:Serine acetyltransferase n=1 Tax=Caulobacter flavus TaxID=1679497 RepID=A0A2N5CZN3_9CAUL|nr:serine O-acetyltransferase [Caulobacter flavus]AYV45066.1 serine O-acetyltransferase [Caulobacter flavus]PLR19252.1 serine O-acetyltransferase [Caulobacter flavus]
MAKPLEVVTDKAAPPVWAALRNQAEHAAKAEPALASLLNAVILSHDNLADALTFQLARKLGDQEMRAMTAREFAAEAFESDPALVAAAEADLRAVFERDPATKGYVQPFLFFKGFLALQTHRVSHWLWNNNRETLAFYLQSRASEVFQVDIHPASRVGAGVFIDHGTGIVIGETAVVGDDVSMLHGVTLGGTGADRGDRHPKIGKGVLLGAGAKVLGNIQIGDYAKVASGSVVLKPIPAHCTAAGVPARIVNCPTCEEPARTMDHTLADVVYDYVI